ncbi:MAG: hypothetical protein ACRDPB_05530, partial [Nocardioidaceae bacterium]
MTPPGAGASCPPRPRRTSWPAGLVLLRRLLAATTTLAVVAPAAVGLLAGPYGSGRPDGSDLHSAVSARPGTAASWTAYRTTPTTSSTNLRLVSAG